MIMLGPSTENPNSPGLTTPFRISASTERFQIVLRNNTHLRFCVLILATTIPFMTVFACGEDHAMFCSGAGVQMSQNVLQSNRLVHVLIV